ncbi:hypothetical protein AC579_6834 [Pseudocercospora musae]|uniref:Uncharacterized protein n=1 Tax=Pseudocercospora musae TaxID=113226 RepID=A0A139IPU0_9PEZI|nr:hypothetical protein AC579_6834 [Pseudocercospora musae]
MAKRGNQPITSSGHVEGHHSPARDDTDIKTFPCVAWENDEAASTASTCPPTKPALHGLAGNGTVVSTDLDNLSDIFVVDPLLIWRCKLYGTAQA